MSVEQYANGASTTISEDLDASETGVDVTSTTGFPTTGNFRVLVGSELMIVTAVSGSTFTVVRGAEGTTAATHTNGDAITHILTKDSHRAIFSQIWGAGFRQAIQGSSFAWINQGSATSTDTAYGVSLYCPAGSGENIRLLKMTAPTPPYTLTAVLSFIMFNASSANFGLMWRSSGNGYLTGFSLRYDRQVYIYKWTSATVFSAAYSRTYTSELTTPMNPIILRIKDDNSNRKCYLSPNGVDFMEVFSIGRTDFHTPDEIGFYGNCVQATNPIYVNLLAWELE